MHWYSCECVSSTEVTAMLPIRYRCVPALHWAIAGSFLLLRHGYTEHARLDYVYFSHFVTLSLIGLISNSVTVRPAEAGFVLITAMQRWTVLP